MSRLQAYDGLSPQVASAIETLLHRMSTSEVTEFVRVNLDATINFERVDRIRRRLTKCGVLSPLERRTAIAGEPVGGNTAHERMAAERGSQRLLRAIASHHAKHAPSKEARDNWKKVAAA